MLTRKLKKIPGITIATALKAREFKMVAEAVEKCKKIGKTHWKKAVLLSMHQWFGYIYSNTSWSSKKPKNITLVKKGPSNEHFRGNRNMR